MKFKIIAVLLFISLSFVDNISAQKVFIGPKVGGNMNMFYGTDSVTNMSGFGFVSGLTTDVNIDEEFGVVFNLNFYQMNKFESEEKSGVNKYNYKYTLFYSNFDVLLKYSIEDLYICLGPSIGFNISAKNKENSNTWDVKDVNSPRFDLKGAVGYNLHLNDDIILAPELLYSFPLDKTFDRDNNKGKLMFIQVGCALKFAI